MKSKVVSGIILTLLGLTVIVYAQPLFSQHFSSVPPGLVLTANCTTLWSSPPGVAPESNGALYFGCPTTGCTGSCLVANTLRLWLMGPRFQPLLYPHPIRPSLWFPHLRQIPQPLAA